MTATMNAPPRARKTLAAQLDRLDQILDGLSEALNESVASAVQEAVGIAVQEAVQATLAEVLGNPEVLARLHAARPAAPAPRPRPPRVSLRERLGQIRAQLAARLQAARQTCREGLGGLRQALVSFGRRCRGGVDQVWRQCRRLRTLLSPLLVAAGVGLVVGVAAYYAGPWLAALAGGLGGFTTAIAVQAALWLRRTLTAFQLVGD